MSDDARPKVRFRRIAKKNGYGYILDKHPELTPMDLLEIECEELREAARLPLSIVENIGNHMSMAQHPLREIEKAAIAIIDKETGLLDHLHGALTDVGCLVLACSKDSLCRVCVALNAYDEAP